MNVSEPYYSLIRDGVKTVEGRKMSPNWAKLHEGDLLKICKSLGSDCIEVVITQINYYPPLLDGEDPLTRYLSSEGLEATLPGVKTLEEGRQVYLQWWSLDEINTYGVMAIHLSLLS